MFDDFHAVSVIGTPQKRHFPLLTNYDKRKELGLINTIGYHWNHYYSFFSLQNKPFRNTVKTKFYTISYNLYSYFGDR